MIFREFQFHVQQRYVRDIVIEYRIDDSSSIVNVELRSGETQTLMLTNSADRVHRYKTCDAAIRAITRAGWMAPIPVRPISDGDPV